MRTKKNEELLAAVLESLDKINSVSLYSSMNGKEKFISNFNDRKTAMSVRRRLRKTKRKGEFFKIKNIS